MIDFRCWYCNRRYHVAESRIGERLSCTCKRQLRIPRRSGGRCRIKSLVDWLVEGLVYGGGGALLGLGLAVVILGRFGIVIRSFRGSAWLLGGLTLTGFLAGVLGGERGVNWIGQLIRDRENS